MPSTEPINIPIHIDSSQVMKEFGSIVKDAKDPDEAIKQLEDRFKNMTAAQLLGVKGAEDLVGALKKVSQQAKQGKPQDIVVTKEMVNKERARIKMLEKAVVDMRKKAMGVAPGNAKEEAMADVKAAELGLEREKQKLKELEGALNENEAAHKSLASQVRALLEEMRQLELAGQKNSAEYKRLQSEAARLDEIRKRTRSSLRGENDDLRALTASVNLMAGAYSTAMGVVGMFTDDTEKMAAIQTKLQSAIALTVGVQQVSEGLAKESIVMTRIRALQTNALAKAKALEAKNTAKATIAQRAFNLVAKANPILLLVTAILSLGAAYAGLRLAIGGAAESQRELNKEIGKAKVDHLAGQLTKYKQLQAEWKALNGNLEEQNKYLEENADKFYELGIEVDGVNDAENVLVDKAEVFAEAMQLRAKSTAMAAQAQKNYEESLKEQEAIERRNADLAGRNGPLRQMGAYISTGWDMRMRNILGGSTREAAAASQEKDADKLIEESLAKDLERLKLLKKNGIKTSEELAKSRERIERQSIDQIINERKKAWENYYAFEATFGRKAAEKQFAGLRKEASSYYDWLEQEAAKYESKAATGLLDDKELEAFNAVMTALNEMSGEKTGLESFTDQLDRAISRAPELAGQIALVNKEIEKLAGDKANIDTGKMSVLLGRKEDLRNELEAQATEFINAHQSIEEQKRNITQKYAALRSEIEGRELNEEQLDHQINALKKAKEEELKALEETEEKKVEAVRRYSRTLIGITRQELKVRIESLEEYLKLTKGKLNEEQEAFLEADLKKAKAIAAGNPLEHDTNVLLEERKQLMAEIAKNAEKGIVDPEDVERLDQINQELKNKTARRFEDIADKAFAISGSLRHMADAIGESNQGLSDTLETMADLAEVAGDAAGAVASFSSGEIVGGISQSISAVAGVFSIASKARASEKKAQEEIKQFQDSIFQSGLDYNRMLRDQLATELEINEAYQSRLQTLNESLAVNKENLQAVEEDMQAVLRRLLVSETITGQYTKKEGGFLGFGRKTVVKNEYEQIANLLGMSVAEAMELGDELFRKLAKINAETPLTDDAKAAYEQLLALKDEYGDLNELQRENEKLRQEAITGITAQSIGDSISQGLMDGKRSFADFADDIEDKLRKGILAGMNAKIIEPQIQQLQDSLAGFLGDGVFTADERREFQEMYMRVAKEAQEYMDLMNQAGLDFTGPANRPNSLQGAYKAASQESIDLLSGNTAALRLSVMDGNAIAKNGFSQLLESASRQLAVQMDIERNTRLTAGNTEKTWKSVDKMGDKFDKQRRALEAAGIIR